MRDPLVFMIRGKKVWLKRDICSTSLWHLDKSMSFAAKEIHQLLQGKAVTAGHAQAHLSKKNRRWWPVLIAFPRRLVQMERLDLGMCHWAPSLPQHAAFAISLRQESAPLSWHSRLIWSCVMISAERHAAVWVYPAGKPAGVLWWLMGGLDVPAGGVTAPPAGTFRLKQQQQPRWNDWLTFPILRWSLFLASSWKRSHSLSIFESGKEIP